MSQTQLAIAAMQPEEFRRKVVAHLRSTLGSFEEKATAHTWSQALAATLNEYIYAGRSRTLKTQIESQARTVHYLSLEFLMGRLLASNLHNLGLYQVAEQAMALQGLELADLLEQEPDMALGNGGLGRLAACFIDSMATLALPAIGYGIHYEHGLFRQEFIKGRQVERPDQWREFGSPWEICRPESQQVVKLYGHVETIHDQNGSRKVWHPSRMLRAIPWDIPIVGYGGQNVNILRLWESRADHFFDWDVFNAGGYVDAYAELVQAETVSKVLYPNDETDAGKELRLIQQYFFSAASIADILRRFESAHGNDYHLFATLNVLQLNDTHPAIAIAELMRLLVDEKQLAWQEAWQITQQSFAYTNHTLLPEALETWSVSLLQTVLPRHMEIIFEINRRFLQQVDERWPNDQQMQAKLSIIQEGEKKSVRMAQLSVVGSQRVNGVAKIHTQLIKTELFPEMVQLWPEKIRNITNGVTPRRWLKICNPRLAELIDQHVDADWPRYLEKLEQLKPLAKDKDFQQKFMAVKQRNKQALVAVIKQLTDVEVSAEAIFDVQIKRLHEYKRQHLNLLYILVLYRRLLKNPALDICPRVFIFGAKAAPGYRMAKDIILAINRVAKVINNDVSIGGKIKLVFLPNYRVSLAEKLIPAADVSQQISLAGKEASGTGNMKLAMNGAITLGTHDGANIEIAEAVGEQNLVLFGMKVDEVKALQHSGYAPQHIYQNNEEIKAALDWLSGDFFTPEQPGLLASISKNLINEDPFMVLADFAAYQQAQQRIDSFYRQKSAWAEAAILNAVSMARFNSDRSIMEYANDIWQLKPIPAAEC
ncbi:glycogen/starch/alpha-glucan phosphorylase [Reinekea thalattae]|uniref:Alpha-1,4 glucan phosphorylase n=1 Tax=Reinekea thalattae TaxID=2593301 RepID=A0A5C8Z8V0_9GAMM|nr:glycogen/starch/alpha-glucan phosphorylase [Reinekea thalattae]TXR54107.1 glycogen/starch/alpha-glucan phosphorylase [Reinekea thalattae]